MFHVPGPQEFCGNYGCDDVQNLRPAKAEYEHDREKYNRTATDWTAKYAQVRDAAGEEKKAAEPAFDSMASDVRSIVHCLSLSRAVHRI